MLEVSAALGLAALLWEVGRVLVAAVLGELARVGKSPPLEIFGYAVCFFAGPLRDDDGDGKLTPDDNLLQNQGRCPLPLPLLLSFPYPQSTPSLPA